MYIALVYFLRLFLFSVRIYEAICAGRVSGAQQIALPQSRDLYEEIIDNHKSPSTSIMEALKLQKKYPEVSRDEMFDFINRFKSVSSFLAQNTISDLSAVHFPLTPQAV